MISSVATPLSEPINSFEGCIFDLDGTLLNTLLSLTNCYNRVLAQQGFPQHPEDSYRHFIGDGARKCVERCLPANARTESVIQTTLALQQQDYADHWSRDVSIYQGIGELLDKLSERKIKLAVLSNKDHEFTLQCVSHFFPGTKFDVVQGYSSSVPHKPDPRGALSIAAQLNLEPDNIVFLGDTAMDIQTANTCGMISVGVLWGFRDAEELTTAGARHLIQHPSELLKTGEPHDQC